MNNTTSHEVVFDETDHLISTTNPKGQITYANQKFCDVAGYSLDELVGHAHKIVRHPDMPKEAFNNLWSNIQSGEPWMGLVKNRCKNGSYYWVDAYVTPITHGTQTIEYQSVRTKPSRERVERAEEVYKALRAGNRPDLLKKKSLPMRWKAVLSAIVSFLPFILSVFLTQSIVAKGVLLLLAFVLLFLSFSLVFKPFEALVARSKSIVNNPLTQGIYMGRVDEISQLELAFKMLRSELRAIIGRVDDSSKNLVQTADASQKNGRDTMLNLNEQQEQTSSIASAVHQMSTTANDMASNTSKAAEETRDAKERALQGSDVVAETIQSIHRMASELQRIRTDITELESHSNEIGVVLDVISGIADQTNLLALNAAIEAARAGEQGRGFSVVADEVRALAKRTQEATIEIQNTIQKLQGKTQDTVSALEKGHEMANQCVDNAENANSSILHVSQSVSDISDMNHEIAVAVEQQASVSSVINDNVRHISQLTNETYAIGEVSDKLNQQVSDRIGNLSHLTQQFLHRLMALANRN